MPSSRLVYSRGIQPSRRNVSNGAFFVFLVYINGLQTFPHAASFITFGLMHGLRSAPFSWATHYSSVFVDGAATTPATPSKISLVFPVPYSLTSLISPHSYPSNPPLCRLLWLRSDPTNAAHACGFVCELPWRIAQRQNWVWWLYFSVCTKIMFVFLDESESWHCSSSRFEGNYLQQIFTMFSM